MTLFVLELQLNVQIGYRTYCLFNVIVELLFIVQSTSLSSDYYLKKEIVIATLDKKWAISMLKSSL